MDRPHLNASSEEILHLIESHWESFWELGLLAYEVQFRKHIERDQRAALIERLVEIGVTRGREPDPPPGPGFEFPKTDVAEGRRRLRAALGDVGWRELGLLRLSGYRVGRTEGEPRRTRRRLLNYLFLKDDLRDIEDRAYAASWGAPSSGDRLKKLAETLSALARNAKRHPADMSQAISDWEEDLDYLRSTFYERWGEFPWPRVDV